MNKYSYKSEAEFLRESFMNFVRLQAEKLEKTYLEEGFQSVVDLLGVKSSNFRNLLFDFLANERKVILSLAKLNRDFFVDLIYKGEGDKLKQVLGLESSNYDKIWAEVLDYLLVEVGIDFMKFKKIQAKLWLMKAAIDEKGN